MLTYICGLAALLLFVYMRAHHSPYAHTVPNAFTCLRNLRAHLQTVPSPSWLARAASTLLVSRMLGFCRARLDWLLLYLLYDTTSVSFLLIIYTTTLHATTPQQGETLDDLPSPTLLGQQISYTAPVLAALGPPSAQGFISAIPPWEGRATPCTLTPSNRQVGPYELLTMGLPRACDYESFHGIYMTWYLIGSFYGRVPPSF